MIVQIDVFCFVFKAFIYIALNVFKAFSDIFHDIHFHDFNYPAFFEYFGYIAYCVSVSLSNHTKLIIPINIALMLAVIYILNLFIIGFDSHVQYCAILKP